MPLPSCFNLKYSFYFKTKMSYKIFRRIIYSQLSEHKSYSSFSKFNLNNNNNSVFELPFESVFDKAKMFSERIAIVDNVKEYKYKELLNFSAEFARTKLNILKNDRDKQPKIAFLCPSDITYAITQWSCWMNGLVAVPLCDKHPPSQLEYYVKDSESSVIVASAELVEVVKPIGRECNIPVITVPYPKSVANFDFDDKNEEWEYKSNTFRKLPAMFVYTSGTTGRPKGVILTHENLFAQASSVNSAWEIKANDMVMHALPLHHLHGILNGLISPLICGAKVLLLPKFDPDKIWTYFLGDHKYQPTVFHAVPTMYSFLIRAMKQKYPSESDSLSTTMSFIKAFCTTNIRFMACGSASLPKMILREWESITGHTLLERYGMTELGMVLTNPLRGKRIAGSVGQPFPGVEVRLGIPNAYSQTGYDVFAEGDRRGTVIEKGRENDFGELLIKGPNVFAGYWNKQGATKRAFTKDGWFKTGDTAQYVNGNYRILGRSSVDIVKSGGYKISSLDVECQLLNNVKIKECAVVGLPDITWGEKVAAVIVQNEGYTECLTLEELRLWCRDKLPSYAIPTVLVSLLELPKNLLGKVNKN